MAETARISEAEATGNLTQASKTQDRAKIVDLAAYRKTKERDDPKVEPTHAKPTLRKYLHSPQTENSLATRVMEAMGGKPLENEKYDELVEQIKEQMEAEYAKEYGTEKGLEANVERNETRVTIEPARAESEKPNTVEEQLIGETQALVTNVAVYESMRTILQRTGEILKSHPEFGLILTAAALGSLSFIEQSSLNHLLNTIPITPAFASRLSLVLGSGAFGASRGTTLGGKITGLIGGMMAGFGFSEIAHAVLEAVGSGVDPKIEATLAGGDDLAGGAYALSRGINAIRYRNKK